jgi:hypothetical protein
MVSQQVLKDGSGSAAVTQEIAKDPRKIWRSKSCPRLDEGIFQKNSLSSFLLIGIFPVFRPQSSLARVYQSHVRTRSP